MAVDLYSGCTFIFLVAYEMKCEKPFDRRTMTGMAFYVRVLIVHKRIEGTS